jgi:ParE toxin of type II toxin-antitoxin system, parDE
MELVIDPDALDDIQKATDWYNEQLAGLGTRFQSQTSAQIASLKNGYHRYSIRYKNVRCMLIKKFPYLVHFLVDEDRGVIEFLRYSIPVVIQKFG